jgi:hypothetical protein
MVARYDSSDESDSDDNKRPLITSMRVVTLESESCSSESFWSDSSSESGFDADPDAVTAILHSPGSSMSYMVSPAGSPNGSFVGGSVVGPDLLRRARTASARGPQPSSLKAVTEGEVSETPAGRSGRPSIPTVPTILSDIGFSDAMSAVDVQSRLDELVMQELSCHVSIHYMSVGVQTHSLY